MKRILTILVLLLSITFSGLTQVLSPVKWSFDYKLDGDEHAMLRMTAKIDKGWHVYSTTLDPDQGPIPTEITFSEMKGATRVGGIVEPKPHVEYDPNFDMDLAWFEGTVTFTQRVKLTSAMAHVAGEVYYMTCDASKCLPPDAVEFNFDVEAALKPAGNAASKPSEAPEKTTRTEPTEAPAEAIATPEATSGTGLMEPVKWHVRVVKDKQGMSALRAEAKMDAGWHVYSLHLPDGDGPVPTSFGITSGGEPMGDVRMYGEMHQEYDPNFMMDLSYMEGFMALEQSFSASGTDPVNGYVEFMCCDAEMCLPPEKVEFVYDPATGDVTSDSPIFLTEAFETGDLPLYVPGDEMEEGSNEGSASSDDSSAGSDGLWAIFLLSFIGGFAALLTPCVFPMIPMTVNFFTKQSKTRAMGIRNALLYGVFIIATYTFLGFIITAIFGADALNALSTAVSFNLFFFVLLIVFGISFLGAFEITLPSSWVNKVDRASDRGGIMGIFLMALVLGLVSFSCTGPIIGTLLVEAAVHGGVAGPLVGMFGFSSALALPFMLFAAFPGWMNSLPKSGGWLNSVKVVLGLVEIGLAFKFLSNADLVIQAHLLPREAFISIWIAVSLVITMYLFGKIRFPHDSPMEYVGVGRGMLGILFLSFTLYLIPGLWGAPLKIISGFPPPMFYSESPGGFGGGTAIAVPAGTSAVDEIPKGADPAHCPHNLNCFHDYETGLAYAKEVNKPIMLDFTGWACVNCRKMEEEVWSDPRVLEILRNEVVLISLYVDEKTLLPAEEQYVSETTGKKVKSIGNKWADFQIKHFNSNAQPQYAIIGHNDLKPLNGTSAYDPNIDLYVSWLKEGVGIFHKK